MNTASLLRAAALAAVLSLGAAAPATAEGLPFSFGFKTEDGFGFSLGNGGIGIQLPGMGNHGNTHRPRACMNGRQVAALVRDAGFRNVRPYESNLRETVVVGEYRRQSYLVAVDPCRGRIVDTVQLHATGFGNGGWNTTGYGW